VPLDLCRLLDPSFMAELVEEDKRSTVSAPSTEAFEQVRHGKKLVPACLLWYEGVNQKKSPGLAPASEFNKVHRRFDGTI
jgi:hypothetical protein